MAHANTAIGRLGEVMVASQAAIACSRVCSRPPSRLTAASIISSQSATNCSTAAAISPSLLPKW